jgi:hypothetical protein
MAIKASGPLSLRYHIAAEFSGPYNIGAYYRGGINVPNGKKESMGYKSPFFKVHDSFFARY